MDLSLSGRLIEVLYRDTAMPTTEFIALAKEAGYQGVELRTTQVPPDAESREVAAVGQALKAHGMRLTRLLGPKVDAGTWGDFVAYVAVARALGAESVGIWVVDEEWTRRACEHLEPFGLPLVLQTHAGKHIGTPEDCLAFHRAVGKPNLKFMYDPSHFYAARKPYGLSVLREMAALIDCGGFQKYGVETDPDGKIRSWRLEWDDPHGVQFPPVIVGFRAIGMDNHITVIEPYEEGQDTAARARAYAAYLKRLLAAD